MKPRINYRIRAIFSLLLIMASAACSSEISATPLAQATSIPATQTPVQTQATAKPPVDITALCGFFGQSPKAVEVGQPIVLYWRWQAATEAYRQDYINTVSFSLSLDGQSLDVSQAGVELINDAKGFGALWHMPAATLPVGTHQVVFTEVLSRQITDGSDSNKDGKPDTYGPSTTTYPSCTIVVK